jgi:hypothetical protein
MRYDCKKCNKQIVFVNLEYKEGLWYSLLYSLGIKEYTETHAFCPSCRATTRARQEILPAAKKYKIEPEIKIFGYRNEHEV